MDTIIFYREKSAHGDFQKKKQINKKYQQQQKQSNNEN